MREGRRGSRLRFDALANLAVSLADPKALPFAYRTAI
jgi:hypothetical protein